MRPLTWGYDDTVPPRAKEAIDAEATDDVEVVGDLLDVIGKDAADHDDDCGERGTYRRWEQEVAVPRLEALGYTVQRIYTGDGDSFGPLTRVFVVEKDGKRQKLMYG